jgi:hypothetical protein
MCDQVHLADVIESPIGQTRASLSADSAPNDPYQQQGQK